MSFILIILFFGLVNSVSIIGKTINIVDGSLKLIQSSADSSRKYIMRWLIWRRNRLIAYYVAGILIFLVFLNILLKGNEVILGSLLAGILSSYTLRSYINIIVSSITVILFSYLLIFLYYYIKNLYGFSIMLDTGLLLYISIFLSIIMSLVGWLLIRVIRFW